MNLGKTKEMLNENAITSTVVVDGDIIENVDGYVYLGNTVAKLGFPPWDQEAHYTGMGIIQQGGQVGQHHEEQEG